MSQTKAKMHKLEVRRKPQSEGSTVQTGANTVVYLDGQLLRGVSFFKFEVKAAGVAKVYMEMFADVDIDLEVALPHKELKGTGYKKVGDKALAVYELSSYSPKEVVIKNDAPGCSNAEADKKPFCDSCGCGKKVAYEKKNGV